METIGIGKRNLSIIETYLLANKVLLFFLFAMILYLLFMVVFKFGLLCQYKLLYGTECRSCGLTRGLASCMTLEFSQANNFNSHSTFIFLCVICQIIFRLLIIRIANLKLYLKQIPIKKVLLLDVSAIIIILTINLKYYG
jgi:hypothetical protein